MQLDETLLERIASLRLNAWAAYLLAAVLAGGAVLLRLELDGYVTSAEFITYYPAVLLAALLCGAGPGLLTALLCGLAGWYFTLPPGGSWELAGPPEVAVLVLYFVLSPIGALAVAALRRAIARLREAERHQEVLVAELQHRTRNLLGVVRSMSGQLARASRSVDELQRGLDQRLAALGRVQTLLSRGDEMIDLAELIRMELAAHNADPNDVRVDVAGPQLSLPSRAAQPAALAIHELATNATKHGALSQRGGRLAVTWRIGGTRHRPASEVEWRETGVRLPEDVAARPSGFGRRLLEKALPYDLGTRTSFGFTDDGIRCRFDLPLSDA